MKSKSIYKVPNGKLIKIFLDYDEKNHIINNINITGDFFAYPEEAIKKMEIALKNTKLEKDTLIEKIKNIIQDNQVEFIGLNADGLTDGIMMCIK